MTQYTIAPGGSDSNPGNAQSPWASIGKANSTLQPGDSVQIRAGTYRDAIRPQRSGTSESARITYAAAGDGNVILTSSGSTGNASQVGTGAIALGGLSYVTVDGGAGQAFPYGGGTKQFIRCQPSGLFSALANMNGSTRCVINGVYIDGSHNTNDGAVVACIGYIYGQEMTSTYNVFSNSYVVGTTGQAHYTEDTFQFAGDAHHNLLDNSTIKDCRHTAINIGKIQTQPHDNVIRNCVVSNIEHTGLNMYQGGPHDNMIENCRIMGSGDHSTPGWVQTGNALELSIAECIVRYNTITNGGSRGNTNVAWGGFSSSAGSQGGTNATNNRVYNNTIAKNSGCSAGTFDFGGNTQLGKCKWVNNIVYNDSNAPAAGSELVSYWDSGKSTNDLWIRNVFGHVGGNASMKIIGCSAGSFTLSSAQSSLKGGSNPDFSASGVLANVYDAAPGMTNYAGNDFRLTTLSPYVGTGAPLASVAAGEGGNGTTLAVDDARFFQSGKGIPGVQGDRIVVGTGSPVQVTAVSASTNTLTLAGPVNRAAGDPVMLYSLSDGSRVLWGQRPDVGAISQQTGATVPPPPPTVPPPPPTVPPPPPPVSPPPPPTSQPVTLSQAQVAAALLTAYLKQ